MTYSRQQYEDRIRGRLGDLGVLQLVSEEQLPLALETALLIISKDQPRKAIATFNGDGSTYQFDLSGPDDLAVASSFDAGFSRILEVEYPAGERPQILLELRDIRLTDAGLAIIDDLEVTPAAGEQIVFTYSATWPHPDDSDADLLPDVWSDAVAALAAAQLARGKAIEYARRQSNTVLGDTIQQDPQPLFDAAQSLEAIYEQVVLGRGKGSGEASSSSTIALSVSDIDVLQRDSLFHRREQLSG